MINVLSLVSYNFLPAKMGGQKGIALFNRFLSKEVNLTCITTESNRPGPEDNYDYTQANYQRKENNTPDY